MKITGVLVDLLVDTSLEVCGPCVVYKKHKKAYVQVLQGLYSMLVAALLWYTDFKKDIEDKGYTLNPSDPCVANKVSNKLRHTVTFHVVQSYGSKRQ
jgi:hypothetical protein